MDNKKKGGQHIHQMLQRDWNIARFGECRQILQDSAAIVRGLRAVIVMLGIAIMLVRKSGALRLMGRRLDEVAVKANRQSK